MINYDLHIHTEYCGHADGMTVEKIVEHADRLGLELIAITDHIFGPQSLERIDKIREQVGRIRSRCRCEILLGAEVDIDYRHTDGRFVTDKLEGLDYILAGFHYVPTVGNYAHNPDECSIAADELIPMWRSTLVGIVSNPRVDTLAHPGRMIGTAVDMDVHFDEILAIFREIAEVSVKNHICWELNELSGYRISPYNKSRWHKIYEAGLEKGVKIVFGSDAHSVVDIGRCAFAGEILEKLPPGSLSGPEEIGALKK